MKKIKKSLLKSGYYYEEKPWYDTLPEKLTIPSYTEEIFPKTMNHREILDAYKIVPYTIEQAFAVAADKSANLKNDEYRLVYFMDGNIRFRLSVFRSSGGELGVDVDRVRLDFKWSAGRGVLFSNNESKSLDTSDTETLKHSVSLNYADTPFTEENAIRFLKERDYRITRIETKEIEF